MTPDTWRTSRTAQPLHHALRQPDALKKAREDLARSLSRLAQRQVCLARRSALARGAHFDVNHAREIAMDA